MSVPTIPIRVPTLPLRALLATSVVLGLGMTACGGINIQRGDAATPTAEGGAQARPTARPTAARTVQQVVTADGALRYPDEPHPLAFGVGGLVVEVGVEEHQAVEAGAVLARLDTLSLDLAVAEARASVAAARARVTQLETGSSVTQARLEVERAKNSLWGNQAQRDAACGRAENSSLPGSVRDEARTSCDAAQASVQASEQGVLIAEEALRQAEATAGDDLAAARAQAASAALALRQAEVNLQKATLVAPFAGTVTALDVVAGEPAAAGSPVVTLTRTRPLRFVTTNLGERFVGDIAIGDPASVTLTAYPDRPLDATVQRIEDQGATDSSGNVVFAVHLDVEEAAGMPLYAGLTGRAEIVVGGAD